MKNFSYTVLPVFMPIPTKFRLSPENHWCLLLAFVGDAIDQGHPNAYLHHLSVGFALGTHHEGVYAERESRLYEPRGGFGHG